MGKKNKKKQGSLASLHRHHLYEASVQSVDSDLDFARRVYRKRNGVRFRRLREDFCGTAVLACRWAALKGDHHAWGVDLDEDTLEWGRKRHLESIGEAAERVTLIRDDVRKVRCRNVDVVLALNFSYFVFHDRRNLLKYFRNVRRSLRPGGLIILDIMGGTGSMEESVEKTKRPSFVLPDGRKVPSFTYIWDQAYFNPVDHRILCHIHFKPRGGKMMKRAFTYDWRLWTIPEIRELLAEAGFLSSDVYMDGWDEETDEPDGIFRKRKRFENDESWIAYIVGLA